MVECAYNVCYKTLVRLTFIQTVVFARRWNQLRLNDDDLRALENALMENPAAGATMAGTGGLRKIRFAPPSRHMGKSGALRVGYAYFQQGATIVLLAIFAKSDQPNLTAAENTWAKSLIAALGNTVGK